MDFSGGFLLPEQKNLEVTASWTPSTPAKPVVVSPPAADGIPRSQHLQPDRLEPVNFPIGFQDADKFPQESRFLNGSMRSWSFTDHLQNTLSSEAVRTSESRIPCGSVEPHAQAIGKPTRRWTRIPLGNGAARGSNIMASSPHVRIPGEVSYGQSQSCIHRQMLVNGNSQERLLNGSYQQLLLNGKLALNPHLLSGYSQMLEEPQNGFSITYGSNNNTYFSSQARTGTTANETTFIPSAPSIPDTNKGVQDSRAFKKNEKADSNKQGMDDFSSRQQDPIHITFDQVDSMPKSMSSAWLSSQMEIQKQGKGGNHGVSFDMSNPFILAPVTPDKCNKIQNGPPPEIIDLVDDSETEGNKEPGCRVVQAEKEPTLIVSKQGVSMHADTGIVSQTIENQNQTLAESQGIDLNKTPQQKSKKKKHRPKVIREGKPARKPKEVTPKSADKVEKPSGRRKYVRRKGINSETFPTGTGDNKTVRRSVKRSLNFDSEEARGKDEYQASALTSQCNIETQDSYDGKLNSTGSIENNCTLPLSQEPGNMPHQTSRGFMFDLNNAINKVPDYFIGQQENVMVTTQSSSREIIRENLKGIVAMRSSVQIKSNSQTTMSSGLQGTHQFAPDSNKISNGYSNSLLSDDVIDDNRLQRIHNDSSQAKYSIYNKRRKENGDNEIIIQLSSIVGGEQFSSSEKLPAGHLLTFDQTGDRKKQPPKAPIQVCSFSSLMSGIGCNQVTSTSGNTLAENRQLGNMETPVMGIATPNKRKPGRPKKVQSHSVNFSPLNSELASRKGYKVASLTFEGKPTESNASTLGIVQQKILTDSQGIANSRISVRETLHSPQLPKTMVPHTDPLDLIVQKLRSLNISEELREDIAQEHPQNALVPYSGNGMIVPFESLSDPTRKRRLRAKVDLDSETNRVWMLLMGKEGAAGTEGTDKDKEKWWEEERKVFRGRVESFIARMHLVQGDRRFSPWKGSVVDSVVGVFLTQNVSDHLSSSAFMSLAARFPIRSRGKSTELNMKNSDISKESHEKTFIVLDRGMENQQQIEEAPKISSQHEEEWKAIEGIGSLERDNESALFYCSQGQDLSSNKREKESRSASSRNRIDIPLSLTGSRNLAETEDARLLEGAVSSQNSVISSQNSSDSPVLANEQTGLSLESNFEVEDLMASDSRIFMDASTSFMNLLRMAGTSEFQELYSCEHGIALNESFSREVNASEPAGSEKGPLGLYDLNKACPSTSREDSYHCHEQNDWIGVSSGSSPAFQFYYSHLNSGPLAMENAWTVRDSQSNFPSAISGISNIVYAKNCAVDGQSTENRTEIGDQEKSVLTSRNLPIIDVHTGNSVQENVTNSKSSPNCTKVSNECGMKCLLNGKTEVLQDKAAIVEAMIQMPNYRVHEPNVDLSPCVSSMHDTSFSNILEKGKDMPGMATSLNPSHAISSNEEAPKEIVSHGVKSKKVKPEKEKNTFDWDCLRKSTCNGGVTKERSGNTMDSVDWEAIRQADVTEISNTIRERGMNNMLAERIKDFLDRLVREHGSIDLEWLRDVPPDKAKDYLLSIRGLGLKSVECVRLLTLHHLAFPVDTNVGRICVRLGWVPLQPLPESLQLHLLELYPLLETIQKYLWPRLCRLDQRTLYELHYQLITFGKVFCTKSKPNCNACPMRGECRHFASAFASARLALPGPEEKSLVNSQIRVTNEPGPKPVISPVPLAQLEGNLASQRSVMNSCEPIIEEPTTPEPESLEALETEIEDAFYEDPDEIPTIKLNIKQFTQNLQDIMQENNMELQEFDMSKALVALAPQVASIPQPKLKNISRLRTEHQVYELPDSHPLLEGLDQRETDDPCPYLLAIWTPGETAQSMEPPEGSCSSQDNGKLCDMPTCFLCNSIREAQAQKVRGTLLIPCRTAMRGSFPLNGTYFQVNEVFADHCSSLNPIDVPREWIWNLPRRTVYFGTSVPTIFRGLTTEGIQHCFWRGFVCVRGFDQKTRAPRPLMARLHFPASKVTRNKRTMAREE